MNSSNITGEVAGILLFDMTKLKSRFDWLISHTNFNQLILETENGRDYWIHVSCRKNAKKNRHQVKHFTKD